MLVRATVAAGASGAVAIETAGVGLGAADEVGPGAADSVGPGAADEVGADDPAPIGPLSTDDDPAGVTAGPAGSHEPAANEMASAARTT